MIDGTRIIIANTNGSKTIQQTCNSWSYLILGKLALTQMNKNTTAVAFNPNTNPLIAPSTNGIEVNPIRRSPKEVVSNQELKKFLNCPSLAQAIIHRSRKESNGTPGKRYPPKNRIVVKVEIRIILEYSAKKKKTKITAECSVINPATNSDSNNKWKLNNSIERDNINFCSALYF